MDEPNVQVITEPGEVESAKFKAWRAFMARLEPTGFTVKEEYQLKWWGWNSQRHEDSIRRSNA